MTSGRIPLAFNAGGTPCLSCSSVDQSLTESLAFLHCGPVHTVSKMRSALLIVCWLAVASACVVVAMPTEHAYPSAPVESGNFSAVTQCSFNNVRGTCFTMGKCQGTAVPNLCGSGPLECCIVQGDFQPGCGTAAVDRAMTWVNMKLKYCQSANGRPDGDQACSAVCHRLKNPQWDHYRSDCSAFVSYVYGLPAPGRVTGEFAPFETDISFSITASELQMGDVVNAVPSEHIMIFVKWLNSEHTEAEFLEEPGCSASQPYARVAQNTVEIRSSGLIYMPSNGMSFQPIRFKTNSPPC